MQVNQVCADCAASGISQQVRPDKARCACCGLVGGLTITPRAWWESQEQFREFFGIAREMGLETGKEAQDRARGAMGVYLGRKPL